MEAGNTATGLSLQKEKGCVMCVCVLLLPKLPGLRPLAGPGVCHGGAPVMCMCDERKTGERRGVVVCVTARERAQSSI